MLCCVSAETQIKHQVLGVCDGEVLNSGSLGTFRLAFGCFSFPFFTSAFSLLQSFSALDMNMSKSKSLSFCLTGSDSEESSFTSTEMDAVEEGGWRAGRGKIGEGGNIFSTGWGGGRDVGVEGRSGWREKGREGFDEVMGRCVSSLLKSQSADCCCTMSV